MSKSRIVDKKHLLSLRKDKVKLSQKEFAELVEIPVRTLRAYEKGERGITAEKFLEMKRKLGYVDSSKGSLRVMIDYLRITFKDVKDLDYFCQTYLYCPLSDFLATETRLMRYTNLWRRGDIWIFDFANKEEEGYQMTLQMSGNGCRQFELILEREGLTWLEALQKMSYGRLDMKVTRIDIALDEMYKGFDHEDEHFSLSDLITKVYHKEVHYDRMKKWNHIGGGSLDSDSVEDNGISIYFGSRQSNCYFNFYEKRYELAKKERMSLEESLSVFGIWNRYEIRLSQAKADKWVDEFVNGVSVEELSKGIIVKNLDVYDGVNNYGFYLPDKKWQSLFGGVEELTLTMSGEPYSIEKTIKWLIYQVSNSLKLVEEADKKMSTSYLKIIFESGELTDEAEKVLGQLSPKDAKWLQERMGVG